MIRNAASTRFHISRAWAISVILFFLISCYQGRTGSPADPSPTLVAQNLAKAEVRPTPVKTSSERWQTSFHAEEPIESPIEIPSTILSEITQSSRPIPKECKELSNVSEPCFVGSNVSLNEDEYADIVIMGQGKMLGANVTTFWVFQGTDKGYRLVLSETGLQLVIGSKKSNRFRKIDIVSMSATRIFTKSFEFSGSVYALVGQKQENI